MMTGPSASIIQQIAAQNASSAAATSG